MKSILYNRWVRIQGVATILYIFAQIDKANIAVAFPGIGAPATDFPPPFEIPSQCSETGTILAWSPERTWHEGIF